LLAGFAYLTHCTSLPALRMYTLGLSAASIVCCFFIARLIRRDRAFVSTCQYIFLPILLPFFFIIYPDVCSLLFILIALWAVLTKRFWVAGMAAILAIAVLPFNIFWLAFLFGLLLLETKAELSAGECGQDESRFSHPASPHEWGRTALYWKAITKRAPVFVIGLLLSVALIAWNGGLVLANKQYFPFPAFYTGNLFVMLFLFALFLAPLHIANAGEMWRMVRKPFVLALLASAFALYWFTFSSDHPWNNQALFGWWFRNKVLFWANSSSTAKALFFMPVALSLLSIAATPLERPSFRLLYPFAVLHVATCWLVEPRYYFLPFILFLLFRKKRTLQFEYIQALFLALVSLVCYVDIFQGNWLW
jgi:alpha-1,2-glucosyltransferase